MGLEWQERSLLISGPAVDIEVDDEAEDGPVGSISLIEPCHECLCIFDLASSLPVLRRTSFDCVLGEAAKKFFPSGSSLVAIFFEGNFF